MSDNDFSLPAVRRRMGIPSTDRLRGQRDAIGFATEAHQMAAVWEASGERPQAEVLGSPPASGLVGAICPHDDYLYAGRVYRAILGPLRWAKTVVLVGVFHGYRRFDLRGRLVFDAYPAWRSPDGPIAISPLREDLIARLEPDDRVQENRMHDFEHSVEALAYWLKHRNPELELLPILVPAMGFERLEELAERVGRALGALFQDEGWSLGQDAAWVISADAIHYGPDFDHCPFGEGGAEAYARACDRDRSILRDGLTGRLDRERVRGLYSTFVDPADPDRYRVTWCGRFSIPFGLRCLDHLIAVLGRGPLQGQACCYGTSVGWPELPLRGQGLGVTAPANLYHFVGYPGVALHSEPA